MLAKDGADWGVKAAYLFAGLAILGGIGIYFFTPEVSNTQSQRETNNVDGWQDVLRAR